MPQRNTVQKKGVTRFQLLLLDNLVWLLLLLFFLFNAFFTTSFLKPRNLINILFQSSLVGMLVLAQGMVMMVGELDLSIDAILAFAPGLTILLAKAYPGLNPVFCIVLTLCLGAAVGSFNGFFVAKLKTNSFLLTLSSQIVMRGLVLFLVPFSLSKLDPVYVFLGRTWLGGVFPVAALAFLGIFLVFEFIFHKTIFGRKFMLTGGNRRASYIAGINTDGMIVWAFVIAGILAAVAGLIAAGRQNAVSNNMGENMVMMAFAGAILGGCSFNGGVGKPIGMLGGALLLGMIDNALTLQGVEVNLVSVTKGALIFITILLDLVRNRMIIHIMHRENLRKLAQGDVGS
jgi:simple sugar transport system permease protein/ribose transport system permease protein